MVRSNVKYISIICIGYFITIEPLNFSETTNFRLFQTERVCDDNSELGENGGRFSIG